jgi:hypothetical protein
MPAGSGATSSPTAQQRVGRVDQLGCASAAGAGHRDLGISAVVALEPGGVAGEQDDTRRGWTQRLDAHGADLGHDVRKSFVIVTVTTAFAPIVTAVVSAPEGV